jgi:hypothetical protein
MASFFFMPQFEKSAAKEERKKDDERRGQAEKTKDRKKTQTSEKHVDGNRQGGQDGRVADRVKQFSAMVGLT